ncbi:MAG: beta-ketoacyl synthase chain length factor [Alphaproteobacteria bacterium]|nr:beta-ketoacyl synthase chain length factor [Alphaproteobacteria bacterium]
MRVQAVTGACALGHDPARWLEALPSGAVPGALPDVERPADLDPQAWRRMSALARLAVVQVRALLDRRAVPEPLPVVWATGLGELPATLGFLEPLLTRGRRRPLLFRGSVHNVPAAWLSITLGLSGPSETVSAGWCTATAGLLRALSLAGRYGQALWVGGDDAPAALEAALAALGRGPAGAGVAALLLSTDGDGPRIRVSCAPRPPAPDGRPLMSVMSPLPEEALPDPPGASPARGVFGEGPVAGILTLAALAAGGGGRLVERSGGAWLVAEVERG